jgi:hypothetical protein
VDFRVSGAGVTPQIPVWDKSTREDGTFSCRDSTFDRERNVYVCPAGKLLRTTGNFGNDHALRYRCIFKNSLALSCSPGKLNVAIRSMLKHLFV